MAMAIRWRPRTIRMRLTLLYTVLFLTSGLLLVALVLLLIFRQPILATFTPDRPKPELGDDLPFLPTPPPSKLINVSPTWDTVRAAMVQSAVVLGVMAAGS